MVRKGGRESANQYPAIKLIKTNKPAIVNAIAALRFCFNANIAPVAQSKPAGNANHIKLVQLIVFGFQF